jgi:isoquinoline 1-oxidoreductase beta subunit
VSEIVNLSRRRFLKSSALAGGGLILGMHIGRTASAAQAGARVFAPNAFVRIGLDDVLTVVVNHTEMGQGPFTSAPMVVAEELDADWSKVKYEPAPVAPEYNHSVYGMQMTGGSTSTWTEWERLRKAGATARSMLVDAAAAAWKVDRTTITVENSVVRHQGSNRQFRFGELVEAASKLMPPKDVQTKDPRTFKIVGTPKKRLDTPDKTNGKAIFGMDVQLPGMLTAVIARPPVFGGKVKSFNAEKAKAIPGVKHVVQIDRGIAVVADGYWPATKGRKALEIVWDEGPLAKLDSQSQRDEYAALAAKPGAVATKKGDAAGVIGKSQVVLEAVYDLPYLAHAPMEPQNCVADVKPDSCTVWTGTQFQTIDHAAAAAAAGVKPEQTKLHTTLAGGGFGRRAVPDAHMVVEAVQVSKAVKAPVKVIWSREDDTKGGYYRPRAYHVVKAGLDAGGDPQAWHQRIVCQSFIVGTPLEKAVVKDGVDDTAVEGARDLAYDIENLQVEWHQAPSGVPTLWLRSVGHTHTAFVVETFIEEIAERASKDSVEFRRELLKEHPRRLRVLNTLAEKSNWSQPLPEGRARGIAVHESFGSFVGHVVEVSLDPHRGIVVHRVVGAIDCGPIVNPDTIKAQIEGGTAFGLTAALYGQITFKNGRVEQSNFHDYPMLRMNEMPLVEAHVIESTDKMGGVGEPCVPTIAPALANALFKLTGKRIRTLPIRKEDLATA